MVIVDADYGVKKEGADWDTEPWTREDFRSMVEVC